ncbi:hypothetical protein K435DRAFT_878238 [Dendrothele bispora CBS 962.96]|uniref:DUF4100 domain-containing protein n=1 Tax=Dendrothele bispora (strain CBS 962.96) TaxID=1314807 RepID=A0A4S8KNA3_DENBC|nr:hypothetical protein K435DRAFT_878238 [Dendrothele bispora CBS 962.96]
MSTPQTVSIIQPMPIPGSSQAPKFDRKNAKQFLDTLARHGQAAGITNKDELVDYIYYYSSEQVQDSIQFLKEFDLDEKERKWDAAKAKLIAMFQASDERLSVTLEDLRDFCQEQAAKTGFETKLDIETYQMEYLKLAGPLVKDKLMTETEANYYFVAGIPSSLKTWFRNEVPEDKREVKKAPTIQESINILYRRFNKNDLCYEWWKSKKEEKKQVHFEEPSDPSSSNTRARGTNEAMGTSSSRILPSSANFGVPQSSIDSLAEQMRLLNVSLSQMQYGGPSLHSSRTNAGQNQNTSNEPRGNETQRLVNLLRACMMCGEVGTHPLHPSKCPKTQGLIIDKLILYNQDTGRYTQRNGTDLPRVPYGWKGGIDSFLRNTQDTEEDQQRVDKGKAPVRRDTPPHLNASTSRSSYNIGLSYGDEFVVDGNVFAVATLGQGDNWDTNPALRSGKDTNNRFNPVPKKSDVPNVVKAPLSNADRVPRIESKPKPEERPTIPVQPPTNPINRQDGWKASLPSSNKDRIDVNMKDGTKGNVPNGPTYHFTSDIQEQVDARAVFKTAMGAMVTLPLEQVIGVSPILQKMIAESTRTRREYVNKDGVGTSKVTSVMEGQLMEVSNGHESMGEIMPTRECMEASVEDEQMYYAMTCGLIDVKVNGVKLKALVDSGSELNLFSMDVPEDAKLPLDFAGTAWSLKGIHGPSVQLRGVIKDAPLTIGGYEFPHHFFVARHAMGKQEIILGQPFLQYYSARMQYTREMGTKMWISKEYHGKPNVCVQLTDPKDPRNTKLLIGLHRVVTNKITDVRMRLRKDIRTIGE